jgi:hypothetical protein
MPFYIGIAPHTLNNTEFVVAALSHQQKTPEFSLRNMSLEYIREHFDTVIFIRHSDLARGINTAITRSIEKLLVKKLIVPEKPPQIILLVKPALRGLSFVIPHQVCQKHWLLAATQKALKQWLEETGRD